MKYLKPFFFLSFAFYAIVLYAGPVFAAKKAGTEVEVSSDKVTGINPEVQFGVSGGLLYFFDPAKKSVYIYNSSTGRMVKHYELEKLGEDMKKSRE